VYGALALTVLLLSVCKDAAAPRPEIYLAYPWGGNVIPSPASHADSARRASVSVILNNSSGRLDYTYSIWSYPPDTIEVIALYQAGAADSLPALATAVLCDGPEACATRGGTATLAPSMTAATIQALLRANSLQVVFFTAAAPWAAGGAMRGTMSLYQYP
jgi:hypothetical protein